MPITLITQSQFARLNAALIKAADIARAKESIEKDDAENRAELLDILLALPVAPKEINKAVPALSVSEKTEIVLDEDACEAWATHPDNFAHAASVLSVRADSVGVVIAAAMQDERLRSIFCLNKAGAAKAVRENKFADFPTAQINKVNQLSIRVKDIVTGDALREKFEVIPDDILADAPPVDEPVKTDTESAELDF